MKKIILFAGLLLSFITNAQVIDITTSGNPIEEGQVFTFNVLYNGSVNPHDGKLPLLITNVSAQDIKLKIKVQTINNNAAVDNNVQLCFNEACYNHIEAGVAYPEQFVILSPNQSNHPLDHFLNGYAGDVAGQPVTYVFKVVQYDNANNEIATLRTFTYEYVPTMGVSDLASLQNTGISVNNTVVKDVLTLNATQPANLQLFSVTGQLVKTVAVTEGTQALDLSGLNSAVYIAKFTNNNNQSSSIRIVKK